MANGLLWASIIFLIIGIIMAIIGFAYWYKYNTVPKKPITWWIYFLAIGGIIISLVSVIGLIVALLNNSKAKQAMAATAFQHQGPVSPVAPIVA